MGPSLAVQVSPAVSSRCQPLVIAMGLAKYPQPQAKAKTMTLAAGIRASITIQYNAAAISTRPRWARQDTSELQSPGTLVERHAAYHKLTSNHCQQQRLSYKQPAIGNNSMGSTSGNQLQPEPITELSWSILHHIMAKGIDWRWEGKAYTPARLANHQRHGRQHQIAKFKQHALATRVVPHTASINAITRMTQLPFNEKKQPVMNLATVQNTHLVNSAKCIEQISSMHRTTLNICSNRESIKLAPDSRTGLTGSDNHAWVSCRTSINKHMGNASLSQVWLENTLAPSCDIHRGNIKMLTLPPHSTYILWQTNPINFVFGIKWQT